MAALPPIDPLSVLDPAPVAASATKTILAANSLRMLAANEAVFLAWCRRTRCQSLPATPQTIIQFVDAMSGKKALATLERYLYSIATLHRNAGLENPVATPLVRIVLKQIRRNKSRIYVPSVPLTRPLIAQMLATAPETMIGLRNKALLGVAYDTLARPSEMAALQIEDLGPHAATVQIRPPSPAQPYPGISIPLTPQTIGHLQAWQKVAPNTTGPLFAALSRKSHMTTALNALSITLIFKAMATAAGLPAANVARISGYSSRIGAAQDMALRGYGIPAIMQAGGWKLPAMVVRNIICLKEE